MHCIFHQLDLWMVLLTGVLSATWMMQCVAKKKPGKPEVKNKTARKSKKGASVKSDIIKSKCSTATGVHTSHTAVECSPKTKAKESVMGTDKTQPSKASSKAGSNVGSNAGSNVSAAANADEQKTVVATLRQDCKNSEDREQVDETADVAKVKSERNAKNNSKESQVRSQIKEKTCSSYNSIEVKKDSKKEKELSQHSKKSKSSKKKSATPVGKTPIEPGKTSPSSNSKK